MTTDERGAELPAGVQSEIERIKRLFQASDDDKEDLATYAREVVRLRRRSARTLG